ncbi:MAG: HAD family phosphatase [Candidatus Moraniibacteriota bacterium]
MIKAIIFDFGGVLCVNDDLPKFWQENGDKLGVDPEDARKVGVPIWMEARVGKIDSNVYWEDLGVLAKMSAEEFRKYFIEYTGFRDELYTYIKKELKGKYKLAILSNQIKSWFEPIAEEKKFKAVFNVIVTSYGTGIAKPEIEIYKKTIKELGVEASECVFVEDRPKNIEPAEKLGMQVIEFKDFNQFVGDLEKIKKFGY